MSMWEDFKADHQYELINLINQEPFDWELNSTTTWKTRSGVKVKIKDMGTNHIRNCINLLERRGLDRIVYGGHGSLSEDCWGDVEPCPLYESLCEELKRRGES